MNTFKKLFAIVLVIGFTSSALASYNGWLVQMVNGKYVYGEGATNNFLYLVDGDGYYDIQMPSDSKGSEGVEGYSENVRNFLINEMTETILPDGTSIKMACVAINGETVHNYNMFTRIDSISKLDDSRCRDDDKVKNPLYPFLIGH